MSSSKNRVLKSEVNFFTSSHPALFDSTFAVFAGRAGGQISKGGRSWLARGSPPAAPEHRIATDSLVHKCTIGVSS